LVNDAVIVELKAVSELAKAHEARILNYLKATGKKVVLLINFGEKLKVGDVRCSHLFSVFYAHLPKLFSIFSV
jgi:GxxExxY protein